jgi:mannitol/fructose-specific phosphotransferase system IIA component (Ntr-type)
MFARWGENRFEGLDAELRGILKEKGLRDKDPFDAVVASAHTLDIKEKFTFDQVVEQVAKIFSKLFYLDSDALKKGFLEGTLVGATPVSNHAALPHLRLPKIKHAEMVIVRSHYGIKVDVHDNLHRNHSPDEKINAFFFLISPDDNPGQHLRILAQVASHVDDKSFIKKWRHAHNEQDLKELLLRDDRYIRLTLRPGTPTHILVGKKISELKLPEGCLITLIHRMGEIIVPKGNIELLENDRLTIIGYPDGIQELYQIYETSTSTIG